MLINDLKSIVEKNPDVSPTYLRSLLKERLQYYILQFISSSPWSGNLLFKGGTCLRFFYDLPRLSEDLDFDMTKMDDFDLQDFNTSITKYFISIIQFPSFTTKLASNGRTLYLKFPILNHIIPDFGEQQSNVLHIRLDITPEPGHKYTTQISTKSALNFSFITRHYSLSDLFAGKIAAIIKRETIEGTNLQPRTKGRDYYDLIWYLEKKTIPNWDYLQEITGLDHGKALLALQTKVSEVNPKIIEQDLLPFFSDQNFVKSFCQNLKELFHTQSQSL
ncbi:MAG: nucleotidyl transferase AbiEii/AbiGii toxin family protein [bacterium]